MPRAFKLVVTAIACFLLLCGALLIVAKIEAEHDKEAQRNEAARPKPPPPSPQQIAVNEEADEHRKFTSDAESAAQNIIETAFVERLWKKPENFYARGEFIERDEQRALVLVRTGVKEGMFSSPIIIKRFLVALEFNGDKYAWRKATAISVCDDTPTREQIMTAEANNAWPSAISAIVNQVASEKRRKK